MLLLFGPTTPNWQRHQALTPARFRLIPFRSPLLTESLLLSFPRGTEMFQFPRFPPPALCIQTGVTPHDGCRVSPFGHPRIKAFSAAPRGFSQPDTSFIGARRQGIHRWLFVAWKNKDARARYAILKELGARDRSPGSRPGNVLQRTQRTEETMALSEPADREGIAPATRSDGIRRRASAPTGSRCAVGGTAHETP